MNPFEHFNIQIYSNGYCYKYSSARKNIQIETTFGYQNHKMSYSIFINAIPIFFVASRGKVNLFEWKVHLI